MQTSVEERMEIGMPGMLADSGYKDVITGINNSKQKVSVTITAIDLATTLTINGVAFTVNAGAAAKTKTELRDLMITAVNAGTEPVTASINDADELYVDADVSGVAFTAVGTTNCSVATVIANEASISFGKFVSLNDAGQQSSDSSGRRLVHLPQVATDVTSGKALGFALHTQAVENAYSGSNLGYDAGSAISVLRKGRVYVTAEVNVSEGDPVYVRYTVNGALTLGSVRNDDDTSKAGLLPGAYFRKTATAGNITVVEINLP